MGIQGQMQSGKYKVQKVVECQTVADVQKVADLVKNLFRAKTQWEKRCGQREKEYCRIH